MRIIDANIDDEPSYVNLIKQEDRDERNKDENEMNSNETAQEEVKAEAVEKPSQEALIVGAAAVGAITGAIIGGSRMGILAGLGLGAAAMTAGTMGDTARAVGEVGVEVGRKAKKIDEEHHVVENTKTAAKQSWNKAVELDEKHHIIENTKKTAVNAYNKAVEFERKHQIIDNVAKSIKKGANALTEKLSNDGSRTNRSVDESRNKNLDVYPGVQNVRGPPLSQELSIEKLTDMGFEREAAVLALQQSNNNLETATTLLLGD